MKKFLSIVIAASMVSSLLAEEKVEFKPIKTSPAFDMMKSLVGTWEGKLERSNGEVIDMTTTYKLVSNGSVIVENIKEGDQDMMSTYSDRFGKLTMTHYCSFGTKPMFNLSSMTKTSLDFDFDAQCGLKEGEHTFVKDMTLNYDPKKDILTTKFQVIMKDKSELTGIATLKRTK
tara:strand:- start:3541 stop:4062 length:522 start_codon:yes stop_codon:yes gene_type:complete